MKKKDRKFIKKLEKHLVSTKENKSYAVKRMDIVLVTLSSAGILFNFELIKFAHINEIRLCHFLLIFTPVSLFGLTIILNILSHWTGYFANKYEEECSNLEKNSIQTKKENLGEIQTIDFKIKLYNKGTGVLNGTSSITLIFALVTSFILLLTIF
ncbi:hypothetical protein GCM10009119_26370 [Algoriphagus jejuensis]|uniref:DUF3899 domain-containing protein n=1 Tax=Algoriphagus jejuensis TaxID=419934 RepID=A0ABN1N1W0_9BACT